MADETINWDLIQALSTKPHKHMNIVDGAVYGLMVDGQFYTGNNGVGKTMQETRVVHHLLDLVGIPEGEGYSAHVDARAFIAVHRMIKLDEQLGRIKTWHSREQGKGGTVGDFCVECRDHWPCDTWRMADGTYEETVDG